MRFAENYVFTSESLGKAWAKLVKKNDKNKSFIKDYKIIYFLYFDIELNFTNRGFVKYNSIFHRTRFNRQTEKVVENFLR